MEPKRYKVSLDISIPNEIYEDVQLWEFYDGELCYMGKDKVWGWIRIGKTKEKALQYINSDLKIRKDTLY